MLSIIKIMYFGNQWLASLPLLVDFDLAFDVESLSPTPPLIEFITFSLAPQSRITSSSHPTHSYHIKIKLSRVHHLHTYTLIPYQDQVFMRIFILI